MESTFVDQIMNTDVQTVDHSTSLQETAEKMLKAKIGCMIVTKKGKPVGIVTERDFMTKVAAQGIPLFSEITNAMSTPIITVNHDETVWEASEKMKENSIHKLPVEKDGKIVGIITASDIVKISSVGSDSQMRKICDQILTRMKDDIP